MFSYTIAVNGFKLAIFSSHVCRELPCHLDAHVPISNSRNKSRSHQYMFFLAVVDYAFHRATQRQKRQLLLELYSTELQLFQDLTVQSSCWLVHYTYWNPGHVF